MNLNLKYKAMHGCGALSLLFCLAQVAGAQGNFEVQVYGSELTPKGVTMAELHSNFTAKGSTGVVDGVLPTNHALHETLEITHGFNEWYEIGFYQFTSIQPDGSWKWVGTHIRPRLSVPERFGLPVGLSLSTEFGYQRASFSPDTWSWEIRPIIDKQIGKWYLSFNPTIERSFHGPGIGAGVSFAPNVKIARDVTRAVAAGVEYYGEYGSLRGFDPLREQAHMIMPAVDLDFSPKWEFNVGVGMGLTQATDRWLIKAILGYRFNLKQN